MAEARVQSCPQIIPDTDKTFWMMHKGFPQLGAKQTTYYECHRHCFPDWQRALPPADYIHLLFVMSLTQIDTFLSDTSFFDTYIKFGPGWVESVLAFIARPMQAFHGPYSNANLFWGA